MDTKIENGGFVLNERGLIETVEGKDELIQRAKIILISELGKYRYNRSLGSSLGKINLEQEHIEDRLKNTANEAFMNEPDIKVISASLDEEKIIFDVETSLGSGKIELKRGEEDDRNI